MLYPTTSGHVQRNILNDLTLLLDHYNPTSACLTFGHLLLSLSSLLIISGTNFLLRNSVFLFHVVRSIIIANVAGLYATLCCSFLSGMRFSPKSQSNVFTVLSSGAVWRQTPDLFRWRHNGLLFDTLLSSSLSMTAPVPPLSTYVSFSGSQQCLCLYLWFFGCVLLCYFSVSSTTAATDTPTVASTAFNTICTTVNLTIHNSRENYMMACVW